MADLLVRQSALALNTVWRARVELAMFVAMSAVAGEAVGVMTSSVYQKRQIFAAAVLNNPSAYVDRFAWAAASNSTIAAAIGLPVSIASSTNANPIVVTTATSHGYTTGDTVEILDHAVNTAANGGWIVTNLTATTFSVPVRGIGVGTSTGAATRQPNDSDLQFTVNSLINDFAGVTALD